ncbi:hypothetical protein UFOVP54_81 [uncultured Caudovirales phage]|uniref:Uncharacterized protein n=1 Tax=uncultured Caudovirales phage TaxID=2100421 RepID=A0A6J5KVJ1_9CAUD|nr:hypothetical protein UFOVP54_81 [uncultured Caudovirales phage]
MAVYRLFPEKDTFISTEVPTGNAGKDEIIEIGGYSDITGTGETNRLLVQYSTTEIQDVIANKIGTLTYSASLHLYLADAYEVPVNYTLYAYPISEAWDSGVGKFGDTPVNTTGVSWKNRQAGEASPWTVSSFAAGVTASFDTVTGGGTWYTGSAGVNLEFTQSHILNSTNDVDINVTRAVSMSYNGAIANNGFIVKLPKDLENNTTSSIRLKYYGADTNTIYPPFLEFKWDDSTYSPGSLSVLSSNTSITNLTNNKGKYTDVGKQRFRMSARPRFPVRSFTTSSAYLINYALPSASYWGLRDENTEEMVVDFDTQFTKISCDSNGAFFDVYMDGLQPERYYRILVKTTLDGSTTVMDNQNIFKVVRNG